MKTILSLLLLISVNISVDAIDIKGRIVDLKTKQPVEFATTVLLKVDSTYITGSQTDTTGLFLIAGQFQNKITFSKPLIWGIVRRLSRLVIFQHTSIWVI